MNSLDAIIATTFLLAGFGLLLGIIAGQEVLIKSAKDSVNAKGDALFCAAIIDSIQANSVDYFDGNPRCYLEDGKVVFEGSKKKEIDIFDLNQWEHYDSRSNLFD